MVQPLPLEIARRETWMDEVLAGRLPVSLLYGGTPLTEVSGGWRRSIMTRTEADGRRHDTVTLADPAGGLACILDFERPAGSPVVEWRFTLRNDGTTPTPILSDIRSLDLTQDCTEKIPVYLSLSKGTTAHIDDFLLQRQELTYWNAPSLFDSWGSRHFLPFAHLDLGQHGIVTGLGWIGHWACRASRTREGKATVQMGMAKTHLRLELGEEIRLPRALLLFWEGDAQRPQSAAPAPRGPPSATRCRRSGGGTAVVLQHLGWHEDPSPPGPDPVVEREESGLRRLLDGCRLVWPRS